MSSDFFNALGSQVSSQFLGGELSSDNRTLSQTIDGKKYNYAKLGSFASKIDQSAEREYLEEGYLRLNSNYAKPKMREISMQQPEATVLVKKKMFASLANNYYDIYMDEDEKRFIRTIHVLFQNKLKQIRAFEILSKIQASSTSTGSMDESLMPFILGATNLLNSLGINLSSFQNVIEKVKSAYSYSDTNFYTTWIEDVIRTSVGTSSGFGTGTGVMEFTNFTSINTNTSVAGASTSFNIEFSDPYELMTITVNDIERAISDCLNINNRPVINFAKESLDDIASRKIGELNSLRLNRKVSRIVFKINPDTLYGKRLIAIVESTGQEIIFNAKIPGVGSVEVDAAYLRGGEVLGVNGLDTGKIDTRGDSNVRTNPFFTVSELSVFSDAVNAVYNKIGLDTNTGRNYNYYAEQDPSKLGAINYLRKKLIFNFAGKNIIQPMDSVHIYFSSKTRYDDKVLSGIQNTFNGLGFFQKLNNTVYDIQNLWTSVFSPSTNLDFQTEKAAYAGGAEIPNFLWSTIRGYFTNEKSGCHVYAGLANAPSSRYSNGTFTVSINGSDNTHYLELSKVNFNPGADVFNGVLYDSITPYETSFDSVYSFKENKLKLLNENHLLLSYEKHPLLLFKDGINVNGGITEKNIFQEEITTNDNKKKKILYSPDGLVYKWKEGIGVLTSIGSSSDIYNQITVGNQNITDPFSGQDVMNAISLLVTGQPYNFSNYYRAGINSSGLINQSGTLSSSSPLYILQSAIKKNNSLWGNFIPFKMLSVDDQSYSLIIQNRVQSLLNKQHEYLKDIKNLQNLKLSGMMSSLIGTDSGKSNQKYAEDSFNVLSKNISNYKDDFNKEIASNGNNVPLTIIGDDVSFNYDAKFNTAAGSTSYANQNYRDLLRKKLAFLTKRSSWRVRANQDINYFIVEDDYDKDYDILAFETEFKSLKLFNNEFLTVREKINNAIKLYNLEFFADTQGHLRLRSPQYNKMPSSVFYNMIIEQKEKGLQIFPQFLLDMYYTQITSLTDKICAIEDQIRLYCVAANVGNDLNSDSKAIEFIRNTGINNIQNINSGNFSSGQNNSFTFISDPQTGDIPYQKTSFNKVFSEMGVNPDQKNINNSFVVTKLFNDTIQDQVNIGNTFDAIGRLTAVSNLLSNDSLTSTSNFDLTINPIINKLLSRMQEKTGKKLPLDDLINTDQYGNVVNYQQVFQIDLYRVTQNISQKILERQKTLKSLYAITKNAKEALSLEANPKEANKLVFPYIFGNKEVPEFLKSMIEDESFDDYGPGSGSRYTIKNSQIISYNFQESPPTTTAVTVSGRVFPGFSQTQVPPPEGFNIPNLGNQMVSATAIDYDMWRMYGLRDSQTVDIPVFNDPDSQCAPYAASLLTKARKEVLKGNVTIFGNEYMQPGDVVYLEQRGMLFYVSTVSHTFTQGSGFTTSLSLQYGHFPGEYIPTMLDLVGKMMYNNRDKMSIVNYRQSNVKDELNIGTFILDPSLPAPPEDMTKLGGDKYSSRNIATLNNALIKAILIIDSNSGKSNIKTTLHITGYYDSDPDFSASQNSSNTMVFSNQISNLFDGTASIKAIIGNDYGIKAIPKDNIVVEAIDLSANDRTRSPSQEAMSAARDLVNTSLNVKSPNDKPQKSVLNSDSSSSSFAYNNSIRKFLNRCIVDCYIKVEPT